MIIVAIITILILLSITAWRSDKYFVYGPKFIALFAIVFSLFLFVMYLLQANLDYTSLSIVFEHVWIRAFNIKIQFGLDNLSILMVILTLFLASIAIVISWREIIHRQGFYYFNLLCATAGIIGVFTATDLFLFFVFWEVMLLPITALIAIWGHEHRFFAAIKFFIFTQISSLCMLVAIISMALVHQAHTGTLSFLYSDWLIIDLSANTTYFMMLGFFIAFAVKLPSVPFHSWLPDAHTQAPTGGSVLLAGILLKTGAYGLIRFVIELFPSESIQFAPYAITLGVISILYGAKMAFAQSDCKRLIAYSSVSHMGFVMMALFAFTANAFNGAIMTMVAHGLSSAALFSVAGIIYHRIHTRELTKMGNLGVNAPWMAAMSLIFVAAAFGLPGLANFIGEFYSLVGVFALYPVHAIVASIGMVGSAVYGMKLFQNMFHGTTSNQTSIQIKDLSLSEGIICVVLVMLLVILGIYPQVLFQYHFQGGI